jgi:predicted permease
MLLILAVACANLGGLLLARGVVREHELSIRIAIGASRKRIFRQLFTESLLLALLGSAAGMAFAYVTIRIVLVSTDAPKWMSAAPDWRVFLFVLGMALTTSLLFGFAPALQMARQKQRRTIARQILVGAQVAASCVLLIIASLLVRAVQHALYTSPGFGFEQVISISPSLGGHGYKPAAAQAYMEQLRARVLSLPGVTSASLVKLPPLGHGVTRIDTEVNGHPLQIYPNWVDADFFRTMEVPIVLGRNFLPGEKNAVIVSQSMARAQWPGESPIGKTYWDKDTVVGVVGNARMNDLNEDDTVEIYTPAQTEDMPDMSLVLKTSGAPDGLTPKLKSIVQNLDPKLFPEISLLKANFRKDMKAVEVAALTVSAIGILAMILAAIGLLGLVAFTISQRTKEIAIRLALGAPKSKVLSAILSQFSWPVLIGLVLGIGGTAAASRILRRVLYGVSNLDPLSYVSAVIILIAIIAFAALIPARRALRLDVARALHQE